MECWKVRLSYKGNSKNQILKNYINGFFWMLLKILKLLKLLKILKLLKLLKLLKNIKKY